MNHALRTFVQIFTIVLTLSTTKPVTFMSGFSSPYLNSLEFISRQSYVIRKSVLYNHEVEVETGYRKGQMTQQLKEVSIRIQATAPKIQLPRS